MAQKPVDKRSKLNTREYLWEVMLTLQSFTVTELSKETTYHVSTIASYLKGLAAASVITRIGAIYYIDPDTAPTEPPRVRPDGSVVTQGMGRHNMWRTMKMLKVFSAAQLVAFASTESAAVALAEAEYYIDYLCKAGYLSHTEGSSPRTWRFNADRYTGPKAPMIQKVLNVYDQNTGRVVWQSGKGGIQ